MAGILVKECQDAEGSQLSAQALQWKKGKWSIFEDEPRLLCA